MFKTLGGLDVRLQMEYFFVNTCKKIFDVEYYYKIIKIIKI